MKLSMLAPLAALTFFAGAASAQSPATMPSSSPARGDLLELVLRRRCQQLGQLLLAPQEPRRPSPGTDVPIPSRPQGPPQPQAQPQAPLPAQSPIIEDVPTTQAIDEPGDADGAAGPPQSRQAQALAALSDLQDAVLSPLTAQLDSADPEARTLAADTLRRMSAAAHRTRLRSMVADEDLARLTSLAAKSPQLLDMALSADAGRQVQALDRLMDDRSLRSLLDPLMAIYLQSDDKPVRSAAFDAIGQLKCGGPAVVDSLLALAAGGQWDERSTVRALLRDVGGTRGLTAMARMLAAPISSDSSAAICELISDNGRRDLLPLLAALMEKPGRNTGMYEFNNSFKIDHDSNDYLLAAAVRLSGQSLDAYKIITSGRDTPWPNMVGFASKSDRGLAVARFKKWWADNKDKPPYRGLPAPQVAADPQPAHTPNLLSLEIDPHRRRQVDLPVLDVATLREQLQRRAAENADLLGSDDARLRRRAQHGLLRLHREILDSLAECNAQRSHLEIQQGVERLAATVACMDGAAQLPRQDRARLLELPAHYPLIFTNFFSLSLKRQILAMHAIQGDSTDTMGRLEPLIALAMDGAPQLRQQAMQIAVTGRYHGAQLARRVERAFDDACAQGPQGPEWRSQAELRLAVKALIACGSPRAGEKLLQAFWNCGDSSEGPTQVILSGLIESRQVGAAPPLMTRLSQTRTTSHWKSGSTIGGTAACDLSLYALLQLTSQSPSSYDMLLSNAGNGEMPQHAGFKDAQARQKAIDKFQAWWQDNKDKAPYKDTPALPVPKGRPAAAPEGFPPPDLPGMIEE